MSRSLTRTQAILLGAVVLAALGVTAAGLFALGSRHWPWNDTFEVRVGFRQARGVEAGTRVRVQGVSAGEVVGLELPDKAGGDVTLTLRLDGKWRHLLRADAGAQIVNDGLVGGKVVEINPGSASAGPLPAGAGIAGAPSADLPETVAQVSQELRSQVGTLVENTNQLIRKSTDAVESAKQVVDGMKEIPFFRSLVKDPEKLLFPPGCEANPWWFREAELFEPGGDRLTEAGRQRLNGLAPQLAGLTRHGGASLVVVAYADPAATGNVRALTRNQAEVVFNHLKGGGAVHKDYGLWSRDARALGLGTERPPAVVKDKPPPPGPAVGVLAFVPQK